MPNLYKKRLAPRVMFGALRLISRVSYPSVMRLNQEVDAGKWLCRCTGCDSLVEVKTQALRQGFISGRCCGNPECDPKPRKMGRPARESMPAGTKYGRLIVTRRVAEGKDEHGKATRGGWMAECAHCLVELGPFRDTWKLRRAGRKECRYPCAASGLAAMLRAEELEPKPSA